MQQKAMHAAESGAPARDAAMTSRDPGVMYLRFGGMIVVSTTLMLMLTYTNVFSASHIRWSEERLYMALLMGSMMTVVMLGFMWQMYPNKQLNGAIIGGAVAVGLASLWLSRSQYFVDDQSYMRGMIPHHSIAILTSERAGIDELGRIDDL